MSTFCKSKESVKNENTAPAEKMRFYWVPHCAQLLALHTRYTYTYTYHFYNIWHFFYSFYFDVFGWDVSFVAFINMQMTFSCPFFFCISIYNANFSQFAFALRLLCASFYLYFSLSWALRIFAAAADAEAVGSSQSAPLMLLLL